MSANYVVMSIEGVLVESHDLKTGLPSQSGRLLYENLIQGYAVVLLTQHDPELVSGWLRKEGIKGFATVLSSATTSTALSLSPSAWKAYQVRSFLQTGTAVAWFVDTDPEAIAAVFLEGVPTMMISSPYYTRPEFRPDVTRRVRKWDDLVTTIESERLVKAREGSNGS